MATLEQEKIFNKITQYYNYAEMLLAELENYEDKISYHEFIIIEDAIKNIEDCADKLTAEYIEIVKYGENPKSLEILRQNFNQISIKIEECKARLNQLSSN